MRWCWTTKVIHAPCYKSKQYRNIQSKHLPSHPAVPAPGGSRRELMNGSPSWLLSQPLQSWELSFGGGAFTREESHCTDSEIWQTPFCSCTHVCPVVRQLIRLTPTQSSYLNENVPFSKRLSLIPKLGHLQLYIHIAFSDCLSWHILCIVSAYIFIWVFNNVMFSVRLQDLLE